VTLRRYRPLRQSAGTTIPADVRAAVLRRDAGRCVVAVVGVEHDCLPGRELDHVRASGALGKKSRTAPDNLISTCANGHRVKTLRGREVRPLLLAYLARYEVKPTFTFAPGDQWPSDLRWDGLLRCERHEAGHHPTPDEADACIRGAA
jgi:5-methylcytosine-specific restriction endonuclease McrA